MNIVDGVDKHHVATIHTLLMIHEKPLYADIWKVGVNMSLRISDLVSIKYSDIDVNKRLVILTEKKTSKKQTIRLNATALEIITRRRKENPKHTFLFEVESNRAKYRPIGRTAVSKAFKRAGDILGLNINTHSMRKSRGKALYDAGVPIEKISKVLNHSNTGVTLRYLGITQEEVLQTYDDFEL